MWNERAEFDIYRSHVTGTTPHRRHIFDRSTNLNSHFSCIFCQTPLEVHQGISNQPSTNNISLTTNSNSSSIPTTPIRGHTRGSQQLITNRSSASSSSTYPPPPNSDMV
jgi:hypothetical protein